VSRLPIRVRLAAAFAVAMALVLTATGIFLYARLGRDLSSALDQELQLRAQDLSQVVADPHASLAGEPAVRLIERGESFAQLLTPDGRVVDANAPLQARPLLNRAQREAALRRATFADLPSIPGLDEGVRLLAMPVERDGRRLILVVGATAENRREALRSLRDELLIAGPIALLLATGLGYALAGGGLRAVDAIRARAEEISADQPGERLPVPPTGDELQRLGTTLNEMLGRLEAAVERERNFVAEAGHELRTPLALMRAELDYALHYATTEDELRAAIRTASDETDRLVALAGALLLIASDDRGKLTLHREQIAVDELLESVRQRFAWRAAELGRPLETPGRATGLVVHGDRLRLEQALGNLVDNALRHGDGAVALDTGTEGDGIVTLSATDAGAGFDPDVLSRPFSRFSRGETARSSEGSGLGLAVVETVARAHGGSAYAVNRPDGGATVGMRLPILVAPQSDPGGHLGGRLRSA
jgi:two-component system, OmpR family, sensor kinase